jgi:hypothetical protein
MKTILFTPLLALLALALLALPGHAQIVVSYVGTTTGTQLPGSTTDFIFGYPSDYTSPGPSNNSVADYSDLTSFSINGGVAGTNFGGNATASVLNPLGTSVATGAFYAGPGIAFALTPGTNSNFNYNDFNVYLMVSNTLGNASDSVVSIDPRSAVQNPTFGTDDVAVSDNTTDSTHAQFVEFNVVGLGLAMAAHPGADLVVSANLPTTSNGPNGYIGAVSFQSVPEPSTYAMLFGGLGMLVLVSRFRNKLSA